MIFRRSTLLRIVLPLSVLLAASAFFFCTTAGSAALFRSALARAAHASRVEVRAFEGSFARGFTLRGVSLPELRGPLAGGRFDAARVSLHLFGSGGFEPRLRAQGLRLVSPTGGRAFARAGTADLLGDEGALEDLELEGPWPGVPPGTTLRAQALRFTLPPGPVRLAGLENARVGLEASDPVLVLGREAPGALDLEVYGRTVALGPLFRHYAKDARLRHLKGALHELNATVRGARDAPVIAGTFRASDLRYRRVRVPHALASFRFEPRRVRGKLRWPGEIRVHRGKARVLAASLRIERGSVRFYEDNKAPSFDLTGSSVVEDVRIALRLRGTADRPELTLSSHPPMPEERLLVMLATGKAWTGTERALREGRISVDVARELLGYLLFGGSGGGSAERLGIKEVLVRYDDTSRGVEVKTGLSTKLDAIVGVEQAQDGASGAPTTRKLGAEYRLGGDASVAIEGRNERAGDTDVNTDAAAGDPASAADNRSVRVEYKKKF